MRRRLAVLVALSAAPLLLAGCAGTATSSSTSSSVVKVVASTDVWGDVVKQVGGSHVQVTSIIDDPSKDPHEYEADTRNQLAVSQAAIVLENGGGYDDFMSKLTANATTARILNAADISGKNQHPTDGEFNEHLWYDFPTVVKVADAVEAALAKAAPKQAAAFESGRNTFVQRVEGLEKQAATLRAKTAGKGVAITEPVPLYLVVDALGMVNKTPEKFSEAIENDTDVPVTVLQQQLALFSTKSVALLAYNEQTTGSTTDQVLKAAKAAGVPVVGVRETLPAGKGYLAWMRSDLAAIAKAVSS